MSPTKPQQRWTLTDAQFALVVQVGDVPAYFLQRHLVIDQGLRGLIIDEGRFRGDVGPGVHTLESFLERLKFWRPKQCVAVLVRSEDQRLEVTVDEIPTRESLLVTARVTLSVRLDDPALFLTGLLGPRREYRIDELAGVVRPFVQQALWAVIGQYAIAELTGPDVQRLVDRELERHLAQGLSHYGLRFGLAERCAVIHQKFDEHRRLQGEAWLLGEQLETRQRLQDLYAEGELQAFRGEQRADDLQRMRAAAAVEGQSHAVDLAVRRLAVRRRLREALVGERAQRLRESTDWERLVHEHDREGLLRAQELEELQETWRQNRADEQAARRRLSEKLEAAHDAELHLVRQECELAVQRRATEQALELTRLTDTQENRRRRERLEWELQHADAQRQQREQDWEFERRRLAQQWDEEQRRRHDALHLRRAEQDLQHQHLAEKLELLKKMEGIGAQRREEQLEQLVRLTRARAETETGLADAASRRDRERIETLKNLDPKALVALAGENGATQLAEVLKHEATEATRQIEARAQAAARDEAHAEVRRLLETHEEQQRRDAENRAADARDALASQRGLAETALTALGQAAGRMPVAVGRGGVVTSGDAARVVVCPACRCENVPETRFCGNCGKAL